MGRIEGKVAIVTGGASGIGRSCAELLAKEGATVVVTDIQQDMGQALVSQILESGGKAVYLQHDVTDEEAWITVITHVREHFGALNILVNNAGIAVGGSILDMQLSEWQRQQAINLDGVFLGVKHSIPLMRDSGSGSIINMSSVAGLKGSGNLSAYNATKGGVRLFTKGVALECAQSRWPIRVNSVHPGIIDTPIWTKINPEVLTSITPDVSATGVNTINVDEMAAVGVPTGVLGVPGDIANGVLFLASDDSTYMTGTELVIDGGLSA
jgi:NAD(P)-dependent dehydrogenase (short-subunit alcohol dehydrogenase family)